MHELAIAQQIVELACERCQGRHDGRSEGGKRIVRVVVAVGKLSAVLPDALRFCFDAATHETAAEGAWLDIVETPGQARCRACGKLVELDRPFGRCVCDSTDLDWIAGEELELREVEVV
jgi:hydrogenase nickel incorporation protein HypA/HybF